MVDITLENFQTELLVAATKAPLLLFIWAPGNIACEQLEQVLTKIEQKYPKALQLAKLNAEAVPQLAQQLSQMFGVNSIPLSVMFKDGQPVDGFVGALSETEVEQFLAKHLTLPAAVSENEDAEQDLLQQAIAQGDSAAAIKLFTEKLHANPQDSSLRFAFVKYLIEQQQLAEAQQLIDEAQDKSNLAALQAWLDALKKSAQETIALADLEQLISANKRDFDARFVKAQLLMTQQQWLPAMDELAEILMRDKAWNDGAARKLFVAILTIIEPPVPATEAGKIPQQDATVARYRRLLSSLVLS